MIGVSVAQLFRLGLSPEPSSVFGFYVLGKPLACICQGTAIYTLLLGAYRSWRCQNAMVRGSVITGGFEILLLGLVVFLVCAPLILVEFRLRLTFHRYVSCSLSSFSPLMSVRRRKMQTDQ